MKAAQEVPVVTHLTQVVFDLSLNKKELEGSANCRSGIGPDYVSRLGDLMTRRVERVAAMMKILSACGFHFEVKKNVVHAYSNKVEAFEAKHSLLKAGFKDCEFQIILEYTRGWGML